MTELAQLIQSLFLRPFGRMDRQDYVCHVDLTKLPKHNIYNSALVLHCGVSNGGSAVSCASVCCGVYGCACVVPVCLCSSVVRLMGGLSCERACAKLGP